MNADFAAAIQLSAELIQQSKNTVIFTGAGISTPSGIPDFRSPGSGLWNQVNPFEVASLSSFRLHPEKFYAWFKPLAVSSCNAVPNPAHLTLAKWQKAGKINTIITQNIDGLHQKAGAIDVIELHGSFDTLECIKCKQQTDFPGNVGNWWENDQLPICPSCGQVLKPGIILFEEALPVNAWEQAQIACEEADLMIVVGSSLEVMPAGELPMVAIRQHAKIIIINFTPTYLDSYAQSINRMDAAITLPRIDACLS
jgi:NAD-dependent deacetylase